ncbi:regulatory protein GemA [Geomonas propionica]|uniref:Regulatory protein GemA n=1 Tax=Geomonas propionica TaxID=2798582 RepID=A0ABS0YQI3_9BACT|nr:regulatory protein GemA [Geomonas propionica]MBJ6800209.1 regulatory protein GemA [Geomonas propionica]
MRTNERNKAPITTAQIKKIHALKNAMAITNDEYRDLLRELFGARSSKDLTQAEAGVLIEDMETVAVDSGVWQRAVDKRNRLDDLGDRPGMASAEQLKKIEAQWKAVSRTDKPAERAMALRHFIERIAKISDLRFLDVAGAGKVLNALKAMKAMKATKAAGKAKRAKKAI